jgi:hypothetical protein
LLFLPESISEGHRSAPAEILGEKGTANGRTANLLAVSSLFLLCLVAK